MLEWISAMNFTAPWAFSLAAVVPALVLAYLRKTKLTRDTVSSVLILKALKQHPRKKRKFKPPLRFFIEVLALLCLLLAVASPFITDRAEHTAILLDTSLSMKAGGATENRFQLAQKNLIKWVEDAESDAVYTLFVTAPTFKQIGPERISSAHVLNLASKITASLSPDSLDASLQELESTGRFERILLISDKAREDQSPFESTTRSYQPSGTEIVSLRVGAQVPNVYIAGARITANTAPTSTGDDASQLALIDIGLSDSTARDVPVSLFQHPNGPQGPKEILSKQTLRVTPDGLSSAKFPLPAELPQASTLSVELGVGTEKNALDDDDRAWLELSRSGATPILLVTPHPELSSGLESLPHLALETASPEQFQLKRPESLSRFRLLIFYGTSPSVLPNSASLFILPPQGNQLFPIRSEPTLPVITSWSENHPITTYLNVPLIRPERALVFQVPYWAQGVMNVEPGPIVVTGETEGFRYAAVGLDLLPFQGGKAPTESVLLLNFLGWLTNQQALSLGHVPGSSLELTGDSNWVILQPDGELSQLESTADQAASFQFETPGIYRVTEISGKTKDSLSKTARIISVNVFLPQESSTFQVMSFQVAPALTRENIIPSSSKPLWPQLVMAVLLLLLAEQVLRFVPQSKLKEQVP